MRAAALVMGQESLLEILSEANVRLFRVPFTPKNVNVKHARAPFRFAQLRRARFAAPCNPSILLRCPQLEWPATRSPQGEAWCLLEKVRTYFDENPPL